MNDAYLDADQILLRNSIRRWLRENVSPLIQQAEQTREFPWPILDGLRDFGYLGGKISEVDGGFNLPYVTWGMMLEEAGYCWGSLRTILNITNGGIQKIASDGTEWQKDKWLKPLLENRLRTCSAISEPNVGSDVSAIECVAVWKGDHYLLNGTKLWITNGVNADICIVIAKTQSPNANGELSAFVVEKDMPGFEARRVDKMVLRPTATSELSFKNVKIPAKHLLGQEGQGLSSTLAFLNTARVNIAMGAVGQAQAALDLTKDYVKTRTQFGKPIGSFQLVQRQVVEMEMKVRAARALSYEAARKLDAGEARLAKEECSIAKLYASRAAFEVADMALQLHGALGYATEYPIERIFRDTRGGTIPEGVSDIQTLIIGRELLGLSAIR